MSTTKKRKNRARRLEADHAALFGLDGEEWYDVLEEEFMPLEYAAKVAAHFEGDGCLQYGDIVSLGDYRDVNSYIVLKPDAEGRPRLWRNPGDDYLLIPKEVTMIMDDALALYEDLVNDEKMISTVELGHRDATITAKYGHDVPEEWRFAFAFCFGTLESVTLNYGDGEWEDIDEYIDTFEDLKARSEKSKLYRATIRFEIKNEEQLNAWYQTHDFNSAIFRPKLPSTWKIEPQGGVVNPKFANWQYSISGPHSSLQAAAEAVAIELGEDGLDFLTVIKTPENFDENFLEAVKEAHGRLGFNETKTGDAKEAKEGDAKEGDAKEGDAKEGDAKEAKEAAKEGDAKEGDAKEGDAKEGDAKEAKEAAKEGDAKEAKQDDAEEADEDTKKEATEDDAKEGENKAASD